MYHSTISWMMATGERIQTTEERRNQEHLVALRRTQAQGDGPFGRISLRAIVAGFADLNGPADAPTLDCCAA
jgi:hypothetical protein